jgi:hypothetical protein
MKKLLFLLALCPVALLSQEGTEAAPQLPYRVIPAYPDSFTAASVAARTIDGLGFRYYWATEGLRPEDLAFRPSPEARSSEETIDHILGLSSIILNSLKDQPNLRSGEETSALSFDVKRRRTLENLQLASNLLLRPGTRLEDLSIVFQSGESRTEYPFWNMMNGPIADALWHVGQVVSFRRSSGNPFNPKVSVLSGKLRD